MNIKYISRARGKNDGGFKKARENVGWSTSIEKVSVVVVVVVVVVVEEEESMKCQRTKDINSTIGQPPLARCKCTCMHIPTVLSTSMNKPPGNVRVDTGHVVHTEKDEANYMYLHVRILVYI